MRAAPAAAAAALSDDSELRLDRAPTDLHSLRAADPQLDAVAAHVQLSAAAGAVASLQREDSVQAGTLRRQRILVTGSAGYLGATLYVALGRLGADVVGLDVVAGGTVDIVADVVDADAVRAAMAGCDGVMHTAARHAPHATHYHKSEFIATNVTGTQHVLDAAVAVGGIPVVYTSTTSLTITDRVKRAEAAGALVWLDASAQPPVPASDEDDPADAPRNKYGRSKLEGERRCVIAAAAGLPVVIVRISRCFPEDVLADSDTAAAAALSTPNLKANELLGRRLALVDAVEGHLRALTRCRLPTVRGKVFTLSAPWPFPRADTPTEAAALLSYLQHERPQLGPLYAQLGWSLPADVGRVYDSSFAVEVLEWRPRVTFDRLLLALAVRQQEGRGDVPGCSRRGKGEESVGSGGSGEIEIDPEDAAVGRY